MSRTSTAISARSGPDRSAGPCTITARKTNRSSAPPMCSTTISCSSSPDRGKSSGCYPTPSKMIRTTSGPSSRNGTSTAWWPNCCLIRSTPTRSCPGRTASSCQATRPAAAHPHRRTTASACYRRFRSFKTCPPKVNGANRQPKASVSPSRIRSCGRRKIGRRLMRSTACSYRWSTKASPLKPALSNEPSTPNTSMSSK